jgi:hypothetical protein
MSRHTPSFLLAMQGGKQLSGTLYRIHLFFVSDFVERIIFAAQSRGFEAGEDRNMG